MKSVSMIVVFALVGFVTEAFGQGRGPGGGAGGCARANGTPVMSATAFAGMGTASPMTAQQMYVRQMQQAYQRQQMQQAYAQQSRLVQQQYEQEQQALAAKKQRKLAAHQKQREAQLDRTSGKKSATVKASSETAAAKAIGAGAISARLP